MGTGFEATLNYRVHEGHDEVTGFFTVGGGTGEHGQFQLQVNVAGAAFTLDRVFVEVFEISAADGSEINKVIVPVILGPRIVSGYIGYREHVVRAGDTLWAIAEANYGERERVSPHRSGQPQPDHRSRPDLPRPGAEDSDRRLRMTDSAG